MNVSEPEYSLIPSLHLLAATRLSVLYEPGNTKALGSRGKKSGYG